MTIAKFVQPRRAVTKAFAGVLILALNLVPLASAFAQTADDTSSTPAVSSDSSATDTSSDVSTPELPSTPTSDTAPSDQSQITPTDSSDADNGAQSAPTDTQASPDQQQSPATADTTDSTQVSDTDTTDTTSQTSNTTSNSAHTSGLLTPGSSPDPSPTVLDPNVFTSQVVTPRVDSSSGALTETIPLDIPPGRNGLQPDLSLQYNSQNTAEDDVVGYGWSLSIPYIERLNKTGSQNLYGSGAYFTSSIDGELAPAATTTYGPPATSTGQVHVLVVAGGGGGGGGGTGQIDEGGGGGAGGYQENTAFSIATGTYTITVGTGGSGGSLNSNGSNGGNSSFGSTTATGGGGGAYGCGITGNSGGSGGGGGGTSGGCSNGGGSGTIGQGNNGGNGNNPLSSGAGGGGANAAGSNVGSSNGAVGGAGATSTITGAAVVYAGGGGGGGANGTNSGGAGGTGGGGTGGSNATGANNGSAGAPNTGGGGGGASLFNSTGTGGNGGSGIVIIAAPQGLLVASGGTHTVANGNDVWTFTSSGSWTVSTIWSAITQTPSASTTYYARVGDGSFKQYLYSTTTNSWSMYDKNGNEYLFGASSQSQQFSTSTPSNIYKWMLEKVVDPNGNYIRYVYTKDHNQLYPSEIIYTGNASTDGPMTISFTTSSRSDTVSNLLPGFEVDTNYRISEIDASVNSNLVRKYALSYTTGNNGVRSLLSSIQETGQDANGNQLTLPAMSFTYKTDSSLFVTSNQSSNCGTYPYIATDATGDGKNDSTLAYFYTGNSTTGITVLPGGSGGVSASTPTATTYWADTNPSGVTDCPAETGTRFVSVTGNGKADIVKGVYNYQTGITTSGIYSNTSSNGSYSWTSTTTTGVIPNFETVDPGATASAWTTGLLGDVNGDGLPDYVYSIPSGYPGSGTQTYFGNGSAWNSPTTTIFAAPSSFPVLPPDCTNAQLVDVNGDGLPDWVTTDGTNTYVQLNTGTGWEFSPDPRWTIPTSTVYESGGNCYDRGMRFVDVNGDSLPDFIRSYSMSSGGASPELGTYQFVFLNTGSGWATSTAYTIPTIISGGISGTTYTELANFKGNGQQYQDVLANITYPKGGSAAITYGLTAQSGTNPQLPFSLLTANKIVTSDNNGNSTEVDYSYSGGQLYLLSAAPQDRKFGGFFTITETHPDYTLTSYYDQGMASSSSISVEEINGYPQIGKVFREDTTSATGTLLKRSFYEWDSIDKGNGRSFVFPSKTLVQDFDTTGATHRDHAIQYTYSTTTGDLATSTDLGEVSGGSDGSYSDIGNDTRITNYSYATNASSTADRVDDITLTDASSTKFKETQYYYDNLPLGSISLGNQTTEADWIASSTYASSTKAYNAYGLVASSTDPDGNKTTYAYDSYNFFSASTTNALNQTTRYQYDYATGKVATTTDPSGLINVTVFDPVGRVSQQKEPDIAASSTLDVKESIAYTDNTSPSYSLTTSYLNSATSTTQYEYFDGLGRTIQTRTLAAPTNTYMVKDKVYATSGLLSKESLPYFASSTSWAAPTSTNALFTTYTYDGLQRVLADANAVGTTSDTYNPWHTTITDPNGNLKDLWDDAFGNLVNVVEHATATSSATTTYTYDVNNSLTNITDALGNVRNFTYDGLSRELTAQDLHAATDTTFGTSTHAYDAASNLTQKVDPNSNTISYTYDALNRKVTESTGGSGTGSTTIIILSANAGAGNQTWTVPSNWSQSGAKVECIGAGGQGSVGVASASAFEGAAGGGGAYASTTNFSLTPGSLVTYAIGSGPSTAAGGMTNETYFNGTASSTASLSCAFGKAVVATATGGAGGSTANSTPSMNSSSGGSYAGGTGGSNSVVRSGGAGGGGSAGPAGPGKNGGTGGSAAGDGGGGGGGSNGGSASAGSNAPSSMGGNGGNGSGGTGGGTGSSSNNVGGNATTNSGGGGGGAGAGTVSGGNGAIDQSFDSTHGAGGGGGGGGSNNAALAGDGGIGGTYGGGGGGGGNAGSTGTFGDGTHGGQGIIVITYTPAVANTVTYRYDSCTNGIGHLCGWVNSSASSSMQYDPDGNVSQEVRTVNGTNYTMSYGYDRLGNVASTTYPDNSVVQDIYNSAGQLYSVLQKESGASNFSTLIAQTSYAPTGQVSYRKWGNGAETWDTYDPGHLYRLTNILTLNN